MKFRHRTVIFCLLIVSLLNPGCALFLLGTGAAGAYSISQDTMEMVLDKSYDQVWNASRNVLMDDGYVKTENKERGQIDATVRNSDVRVKVDQLGPKAVRLRVRARKMYNVVPDLDLAKELFNKIYKKTNRGLTSWLF